MYKLLSILAISVGLIACEPQSQDSKDREHSSRQQSQYSNRQPVPTFDWSMERHMLISLYNIRNTKVTTHSVWRGHTSVIEGDCPSLGFSLPYDTSLTNPLKRSTRRLGASVIEQSEPNGIYASKNTAATWVMCVNSMGIVEPVYVETAVTVYPYTLTVDYVSNRTIRNGESSVSIDVNIPLETFQPDVLGDPLI